MHGGAVEDSSPSRILGMLARVVPATASTPWNRVFPALLCAQCIWSSGNSGAPKSRRSLFGSASAAVREVGRCTEKGPVPQNAIWRRQQIGTINARVDDDELAAIERMLEAIHDPVTRVEAASQATSVGPRARTSVTWHDPATLVIKLAPHDWSEVGQDAASLAKDLEKAKVVVIDLRDPDALRQIAKTAARRASYDPTSGDTLPRTMLRALPLLLLILSAAAPGCAPAAAPVAPWLPVSTPPPMPDVPFPSSPAGNAATAWLHAVNDGSREELLAFYRARYAPALNENGAAERRRDSMTDLRVLEGRRHVRAIEQATDFRIVAILETERTETWSRLVIDVDPSPPHLIVDSRGEMIDPPGEVLPKDDHEAAAILDAYIARLCDRGAFSGSIAVARQGTMVYERACGLASRAYGVPNKVDTKFNLGSMNKMFTAVSIAQLVDAGRLRYDDTLAKAWPEYPNRAVAEKITIHQLLTHTSGLGDYFTDEYERTAKDRLRAIKDYLPLFVDKPLQFEPGTRFSYSNAGFMVLGGVVEHVSGQDYFDYVRAHVYAPAGMRSCDAYEMDHDTPNLAIGYTWDRSGPSDPIVLDKVRNNLYLHVVKGGPAGGGFSTALDLIAFGDALVRGKLVSPAQLGVLTTPKTAGFGGGSGSGYGYGFDIQTVDGQRVVGHGGGFSGINARLSVLPESGLSIAAMANLDPPAAERVAFRARRLFAREAGLKWAQGLEAS